MAANGNETSSIDRAFFRVRTTLPLRATPVVADDYRRLANEILARIDPDLPEVDPALIGWLDRLERKLDRLLDHHGLAANRALHDQDRVPVELSGSGLSLPFQGVADAGAALLIEFELPETPIRVVRCLARVVENPGHTEDEPIAVAFETIRQVDRDAVVRHTLAVQRQARAGERNGLS